MELIEKQSFINTIMNKGYLVMLDNQEDRKIMWYSYNGFIYKYDNLLEEMQKLTNEEFIKQCKRNKQNGLFII